MNSTDQDIHEYLRTVDMKNSNETQQWLDIDNSKKFKDSRQKIKQFTKPAISSIQKTKTDANNAINKLIRRKLQSLSSPSHQQPMILHTTKARQKKFNSTVQS